MPERSLNRIGRLYVYQTEIRTLNRVEELPDTDARLFTRELEAGLDRSATAKGPRGGAVLPS